MLPLVIDCTSHSQDATAVELAIKQFISLSTAATMT